MLEDKEFGSPWFRSLLSHAYRYAYASARGTKFSKEAGEEAKTLSVLAAGKEIDVDDLELKKGFSLAMGAPTYSDLMLESYASLHPKLSFVHAYPGFVRTPIASSSSSTLINGLTYPMTTSAEDCAECMWHALLSAKEGLSRSNQKGDYMIRMKQYFGNIWKHVFLG